MNTPMSPDAGRRAVAHLLLALWLGLNLSGCGGGSDTPPDLGELPLINNYNYAYAYAVGAGAYERYGEMDAVRALALQTILARQSGGATQPGIVACAKGGSISLSVQAPTHHLTLQNCDTGRLFVLSGTVKLQFNGPMRAAGQLPPLEYDTYFESVSYRADSTAQMMQNLQGVQGIHLREGGLQQEHNSSYTVSRLNKQANYYAAWAENDVGTDEPDLISKIVVRPDGANQFGQSLDVTGNLDGSQVTVTGRGDKSSVTGYRLPPDGQTLRLEVRAKDSATPSLVRALSAADIQELIWRAL